MGEIINPYIAGAPVTEQRMFFGREDIFQWIENSVAGQYADHILVIHGQRRVGKTSVLKQLGNRLPKRYIPVFFDLQGRTHTTLDRFLWWLAREIVRVLKQERGVEVSLPEKEDFAKDLEHFENRFLPDLKPVLDGSTLLLTFDEFDNLEDPEIKEVLGRPLVDHLRRLMGSPGLNFIFSIGSSGRKLENMQASYTDFFKTALYKKISFLNEEQTHGLITRPVKGVLEYEKPAVERIYQIASGHPYFTQLTCHELFARCQRTEQRKVTGSDVEAILEDVVERGTVNLKFVWDEATDIEKWSLSALAQLEKSDTRSIADYLRKERVRFSESDLTSGLLHLREKDVLTPDNRFIIHLLKLWLQKNRPIEQAREELTEVNPIANRYIEIGLEFKGGKLYDKAIESFQEALAVSKDNLQAQVNIALTYMDQKMHDKAIVEFEKALTMDDEDVSARAGLCEAHLALGDAAMTRSRTKDAVLSYQRVLSINAEHTEARGRMAELSRQRAEKALMNGRDEEALSAFAEALTYTPEDSSLSARVDQVRAEKKAGILAALLARAEREAGAKDWQAVIRSLEEALPLSPADETIPKRIEEAKAALEKEAALAAVYAEAQKAYTGKDYDRAVSLFKKIIVEDENYKDASRLLAGAIELRRTAPKWWQKKAGDTQPGPVKRPRARSANWVSVLRSKRILAIGLLSVLALGIVGGGLFWLRENGLLAAPASTAAQTAKPALDPAIQAALDLIQDEEPLYQTSFDAWEFGDPENNAKIENGKLLVTSENQEHAGANVYNLVSDRFVVEFELRVLDAGPEGHCVFEIVNEYQTEDARRAISAEFHSDGLAVLSRYVYLVLDGHVPIAESKSRFDVSKSNTVTVIILGDRIAAFVDGQLAYTALDPDGGAFYTNQNLSANATIGCEYDNFKIWDLSGMDSADAPRLDPAIQAALDIIQSEEPLYQTTFDDWDTDDTGRNAAIMNGKLVLTSKDENGAYFGLNAYPSDRYVVEFEFSLAGDASSNGVCFYGAGNGVPPGESFRGFTAEFFPGEGLAVLARYVPQTGLDVRLATAPFDKTKSNMITLVVLGDQITAFINGQLTYTAQNHAGSIVYVSHGFSAYNQAACEFDYFKYWDLREMDPAVKTALAAMSREEPLYQTSFGDWESWDSHGTTKVENGKLIVTSENQQHAGVDLYNLISDKYAVEFDFRISDSSPEGHCVFETSNDYDEANRINKRALSLGFWSDGWSRLSPYVHQTDEHVDIATGRFDASKSNTVRLIILGEEYTVFFNGQLAYTATDPGESVLYTRQALSANYTMGCEYDNFKIWDLSGVDFSEPAGTANTPPTPSVWVTEVGVPTFAYLVSHPATFEDDFSTSSNLWGSTSEATPVSDMVKDGALSITKQLDRELVFPTNGLLDSFDFAVQVRIEFNSNSPATSFAVQFRSSADRNTYYRFTLSDRDWGVSVLNSWQFAEVVKGKTGRTANGTAALQSGFNEIWLLARGGHLAVYLNQFPLTEQEIESLKGRNLFFAVTAKPSAGSVRLDNIVFWNLDGVDVNP
jgi:tetratricopeptide (TPR) repeat protein